MTVEAEKVLVLRELSENEVLISSWQKVAVEDSAVGASWSTAMLKPTEGNFGSEAGDKQTVWGLGRNEY